MITLAYLFNLFGGAAAIAILWRVEPAIARMDRGTHWMIRYALLLLACGALAALLCICSGASVDPLTVLILAGIALLLLCERRISYLVRIRRGGRRA